MIISSNLLHNGGVLVVEGNGLDDRVHLVPELGGLQESVSRYRTLTCRSRYFLI